MFFLFLHYQGISQDFPIVHYSKENGLPGNAVYDVYRDSKGFLWFGTDEGIARFDGRKFEKYTTYDGLPDNEIFFFAEDYEHRIWLSTYNGKLCFYQNGQFHTASNTPFLNIPYKRATINYMRLEKDSSISLCYSDETRFINIKGEKVFIFQFEKLYRRSDTNILIGVQKISGAQYELNYSGNDVIVDTNYHVLSRREHKNGNQYIMTLCQGQRYHVNTTGIYGPQEQLLKSYGKTFDRKKDLRDFSNNRVTKVYYDGNQYFTCTYRGMVLDSGLIFPSDKISGITQDMDGNYWVTTLNNGVYHFSKYFRDNKEYTSVANTHIKFAFPYNNSLFFTTTKNDLYRKRDNTVTRIFNYSTGSKKALTPILPAYTFDSGIYYSYYNGDIYELSHLSEKEPVILLHNTSNFNNSDNVRAIWPDGNNLYRFSSYYIDYLDFEKQNGPLLRNYHLRGSRYTQRIIASAQDKDRNIWYATTDSVYKIINRHQVPQNQFHNIHFNWFNIFGDYLIGGTQNGELIVCSNINGPVVYDTTIIQDCIWEHAYKIDNAHILIATDNLYRILTLHTSRAGNQVEVKTIEDPFIPLQPDFICSDGSNVFFFKHGKIAQVNIHTFLQQAPPPKLFFSSLRTHNNLYTASYDLTLPFEEAGNMKISFAAISFASKEIHYEYSVSTNGKDNWRGINNEVLNFVIPGAGNYIIKIKARTMASNYCAPVVISLHVRKPWWATWWAIAIYIAFIVSIIYAMVQYTIRKKLRKNEKEHQAQIKFLQSEYRALNALMNPHFIFNSLNSIQGLINDNDKRSANEYVSILSMLIRENMQNIAKDLIPLQKEIDLVINYLQLERLRFADWLNYELDIDDGLDLDLIIIPPLLIQPLVENSIKHGLFPRQSPNSLIIFRIYEQEDVLIIEVEDNGVGFTHKPGSDSHESYGLKNITSRADQLRNIHNMDIRFSIKEIRDVGGKVTGTKATVTINIITLPHSSSNT